MMTSEGTLLYCAICKYTEKPQILGRLLQDGNLLILRFHSGTSLLKCDDYQLSCSCGFAFLIHQGSIAGTIRLESL